MNKKLTKLAAWSRIATRLARNPGALNASVTDFQFLSDDETIRYLKDTGKGIVRYGDGELNFVAGYPAVHQTQDPALRAKLTRILREYDGTQPYLLALPLDLLLTGNFAERNSTQENWRAPRYTTLPFLKKGVTYGSPFCFRLQDVISESPSEYRASVISLLEEKEIIYVGHKQHFEGRLSPVHYISIPKRDAYATYDQTLEEITGAVSAHADPLVLVSAGVTATALAHDLNSRGILTYDIGALLTRLIPTNQ
ncbi:MAG: GT-D fold domain-containing glycosyltransferase [Candidatus Paceibacterota bacterium]